MSHSWADNSDCTVQRKANPLIFKSSMGKGEMKFLNQEGFLTWCFCLMQTCLWSSGFYTLRWDLNLQPLHQLKENREPLRNVDHEGGGEFLYWTTVIIDGWHSHSTPGFSFQRGLKIKAFSNWKQGEYRFQIIFPFNIQHQVCWDHCHIRSLLGHIAGSS